MGRRFLYLPGGGIIFALLLLAAVEAWLHTDAFLYRYRSVFAVGRAMDKLRYVEMHPIRVLLVGNSRIDNAFDPITLQVDLPGVRPGQVFNLGMPGADAKAVYGVFERLAARHLLGPNRIDRVVIGLDESLLQAGDLLGYGPFFADRRGLWEEGEYLQLLRSGVRLWGFADNLKELREPAKLDQFVKATWRDVDPIGGPPSAHLGYRAGFGGLQDAAQASRQEAGSKKPPDPKLVGYFFRSLDLLVQHDVEAAVVFPPLLNREVLYLVPSDPEAPPYLEVAAQLVARGIPMIALDPGGRRSTEEFVNPGHLNNRGAQRFTRLLGERLRLTWSRTLVGVSR